MWHPFLLHWHVTFILENYFPCNNIQDKPWLPLKPGHWRGNQLHVPHHGSWVLYRGCWDSYVWKYFWKNKMHEDKVYLVNSYIWLLTFAIWKVLADQRLILKLISCLPNMPKSLNHSAWKAVLSVILEEHARSF